MRTKPRYVVAAVVVIGICVGIAVAVSMRGGAGAPGAASGGAGVTLASFEKVEMGMDCADLPKIFGGEGTVTTEAGEGASKLVGLTWLPDSKSGASAVISCIGGKVVAKTQVDLK